MKAKIIITLLVIGWMCGCVNQADTAGGEDELRELMESRKGTVEIVYGDTAFPVKMYLPQKVLFLYGGHTFSFYRMNVNIENHSISCSFEVDGEVEDIEPFKSVLFSNGIKVDVFECALDRAVIYTSIPSKS